MSSFTLQGQAIPDGVRVVGFRGDEGLSELYAFDVHFQVPNAACADLDLDSVVGSRASLAIARDESARGEARRVHGIVSEIELVQSQDGQALLTARLVPELFRLTESLHSRMFTAMPVGDIIQAVLDGAGYAGEVDMRLNAEHPEEAHVCQYKESDYAFIARWMEREGIYFFFDHSGDEEKLVIADSKAVHEPCQAAPVRYHPVAGADASAGRALQTFRSLHRALPAKVVLRDYDHASPALDVSGEADVSSIGVGELVLHEERFLTPADGSRLAALRAEELLATASVFDGAGTEFDLCPGYTFELEGHDQGELNQAYLVVTARHEGAQSLESAQLRRLLALELADGYRASVRTIPDSVQFRAARRTPWPRVHGFELAVVDGAADSEYAQLDEYGSYHVKPHFDEGDLANGSATTRVRMMQPHAGAPEGWHFPLRKGTEVALTFMGGDPDRPLIAGAVPNAETPSVVNSENHTQNVIQTGGSTRIELEDNDGKQHVIMSTPPQNTYLHMGEPFNPERYITLHTDCDCLFDFGTNQDVQIGEVGGGGLMETVVGDVTEDYHDTMTTVVQGLQKTVVTGAVTEQYLAKHETTVHGGLTKEIDNNGQSTLLFGAREEIYQTGQTTICFGGTHEVWLSDFSRTVTGDTAEEHNGPLTETVGGAVTEMAATVQETFGPTTSTFASYTWIAPSITVATPTSTRNNVSRTQQQANEYKIWPILFDPKASDGGHTSFKLEVVGTAIGVSGVKLEANGCAIGLRGPCIEVGAQKVDLGGLKVDVAAIVKNWGK